jgi:hypothetical protein
MHPTDVSVSQSIYMRAKIDGRVDLLAQFMSRKVMTA